MSYWLSWSPSYTFVGLASLLLTFFVGVQRHVTGSVVWNQASVVAKQGDNLALVCTVHGAGFFDVVRLTLTPRSVAVADTESSIRWTISDNDEVKYEFSHLTRYRINYRIVGGTATVRLNITGVQGEDSGILGCHKLQSATTARDQSEQSALVHVKILVPISSVRIIKISATGNDIPIDNGNDVRVTLTQGRMDGVACIVVVDGTANAPPEVEITMSDINGTNDETDAFHRNSSSMPVNGVELPGGGPAHYHTVVRLAYVTDEPEVNFNRMTMRCTAVQAGFPKVVTSVNLEVRYAPIINCTKSHLAATIGHRVTVRCTIRANPGSDDVTWSYVSGAKIDEDLHTDPNVHIDYRLLDDELSEASLTIKNVVQEHYQTYCLTATNDVGQRRSLITLVNASDLTTVVPPREQRRNILPSSVSPTSGIHKAAQTSGTRRPPIIPASLSSATSDSSPLFVLLLVPGFLHDIHRRR